MHTKKTNNTFWVQTVAKKVDNSLYKLSIKKISQQINEKTISWQK